MIYFIVGLILYFLILGLAMFLHINKKIQFPPIYFFLGQLAAIFLMMGTLFALRP